MVMTLDEFTSIFQFVGQVFFGAFKALDTPIVQDNATAISLLTIIIGLFIADLLVEKILEWIQGV